MAEIQDTCDLLMIVSGFYELHGPQGMKGI